jgi:hypothetical protein
MSPKLKAPKPTIEPDGIGPDIDDGPAAIDQEPQKTKPAEEPKVKNTVYLPASLDEKVAAYSRRYRLDRSAVIAKCVQAFLGSMAISFRGTKAPEDFKAA